MYNPFPAAYLYNEIHLNFSKYFQLLCSIIIFWHEFILQILLVSSIKWSISVTKTHSGFKNWNMQKSWFEALCVISLSYNTRNFDIMKPVNTTCFPKGFLKKMCYRITYLFIMSRCNCRIIYLYKQLHILFLQLYWHWIKNKKEKSIRTMVYSNYTIWQYNVFTNLTL